jgi:hypothetical protein
MLSLSKTDRFASLLLIKWGETVDIMYCCFLNLFFAVAGLVLQICTFIGW